MAQNNVVDPVEVMNRRIGNLEISRTLHDAGLKASEVLTTYVDQTGKHVVVQTVRTEMDRRHISALIKHPRFEMLSSTESRNGTWWLYFENK